MSKFLIFVSILALALTANAGQTNETFVKYVFAVGRGSI